jgi:hypothetical protein
MKLFKKDIFSKSKISQSLSEKIIYYKYENMIKDICGLNSNKYGKLKSISQFNGFRINSKNYLFKFDKKSVVIKEYCEEDVHEISKHIAKYKYIKDQLLPGPYLIEINGEFEYKINNTSVIAVNYIEGSYFSGSYEELVKTSKAIYEFSQSFKSYNSKKECVKPCIQPNSLVILEEFLSENKYWKEKFDKETYTLLSNSITYISDNIKYISEKTSILIENDNYFLHNDLNPHNILINKDKANIIDVESIKNIYWPVALGFATFKILRQTLIKNKNLDNLFLSNSKLFMNKIVSSLGIYPIPFKLIFFGAKTEVIRRILLILEGNLGKNKSPWNSVLLLNIYALYEIDFMEKKFMS